MRSVVSKVVEQGGCMVFAYLCIGGFITLIVQLYIINGRTGDNFSYVKPSNDPRITDSRKRIELSYESKIRLENNVTNWGCQIPKLIPFHPSVHDLVGDPKSIACSKNIPHWFSVPSRPTLVLKKVKDPTEFGYENCCFHEIIIPHTLTLANFKPDDLDDLTDKNCTQLTWKETPIPNTMEYIGVLCEKVKLINPGRPDEKQRIEMKMVDMFALAPNKHAAQLSPMVNGPISKKLNVVILGLDSVSHMNFMRTMPFSYLYLTETLHSQGMQGYVSVAANTLPNIIPMLTGLSLNQLKSICWRTRGDPFDACPFIWKDFSKAGYATSFAEDATELGVFSYSSGGNGGFRDPPVDYYLHPFTALQEKLIGFQPETFSSKVCYGPRLSFAVLLNFMKRLAVTLPINKNYFQLTWATSLFHSDMNYANLGDSHLLQTLKWFREKVQLGDTVLVLMSDHGMRYGEIRKLKQGQTEERMPFLFMVFPKWFTEKYPTAIKNYKENQNKLTTPFDLHETLKDLLNPDNISDDRIKARSADFTTNLPLPRGISLFLPIPAKRNCADANIDLHFCICFPKVRVRVNNSNVRLAAKAMVEHVNQLLSGEEACAELKVDRILIAEHRLNSSKSLTESTRLFNKKEFIDLGITLITKPGGAVLEGTLILSKRNPAHQWKVSGAVSRIDHMKGNGHCMEHGFLKQYCFCKTPGETNLDVLHNVTDIHSDA